MLVQIDTREGIAVPEAKVVMRVQELVEAYKRGEPIPAIGQHEMLLELRCWVKRGDLDSLTFMMDGITIRVDKNGQLDHYPHDFLGDLADSQLSEIIT